MAKIPPEKLAAALRANLETAQGRCAAAARPGPPKTPKSPAKPGPAGRAQSRPPPRAKPACGLAPAKSLLP